MESLAYMLLIIPVSLELSWITKPLNFVRFMDRGSFNTKTRIYVWGSIIASLLCIFILPKYQILLVGIYLIRLITWRYNEGPRIRMRVMIYATGNLLVLTGIIVNSFYQIDLVYYTLLWIFN